jgi:hypothetical protein
VLYFATKPDEMFKKIFSNALDFAIESTDIINGDEDWTPWGIDERQVDSMGGPEGYFKILKEIKDHNDKNEVFRISDYYWGILYFVLEEYCDLYNDGIFGSTCGIEELDKDLMVDVFFWDTDFFLKVGFPEKIRESVDVSYSATRFAHQLPIVDSDKFFEMVDCSEWTEEPDWWKDSEEEE